MSSTPFPPIVRIDRELSAVVENDPYRLNTRNDDRTGINDLSATTQTSSGNASTSTQIIPDVRSLMQPEEVKDKRCWICFGEESDSVGKWVRPCKCSLICHEECLLAWITENQKSTALKKSVCSNHDGWPRRWRTTFGRTLELEDLCKARIADPVMPLIPMLFIRYDQLRTTMPLNPSLTISLLPWARIIYNYTYTRLFGRLEQSWRRQLEPYSVTTDSENGENGNERRRENQDMLDRLDRSNAGRKIIGALCLPFISAMVGSFLGRFSFIRSRIPDTFHRNVLGGCLFIVIKDIMNLTYKYQRAKHRRSRHIKNYTEFANEELTSNTR
ncbi:15762_t:CDS:2 [Racocetra persica]|uniref:15762_t:CDS:1 n=1 Tax=Racocetra persica TaxID=160502 RepID=A0ACA9MC22_9GLOM|nr:15762_t:CDS:2 [Racocetra persica]